LKKYKKILFYGKYFMERKAADEIIYITKAHKQLKRDADRESLTIREEAARTVEDFEKLFKEDWDRIDGNRERRERRYEYLMSNEMFDWNLRDGDNFIDMIYNKPSEMHQFVEDADLSRLIKNSTQKQKAVFFPFVIRGCGTTKISKCHYMTDRNVRKLCDLMTENIKQKMAVILVKRIKKKEPLTIEQWKFISDNIEKYCTEKEKAALTAALINDIIVILKQIR
jgi:hypothetical protein